MLITKSNFNSIGPNYPIAFPIIIKNSSFKYKNICILKIKWIFIQFKEGIKNAGTCNKDQKSIKIRKND